MRASVAQHDGAAPAPLAVHDDEAVAGIDDVAVGAVDVRAARVQDVPHRLDGFAGQGHVPRGVVVEAPRFGDPAGRLQYDPNHPLADENGFVRAPDMDLTDQMTSLIIAQRAYQANVTVFERARDAYIRALEIGN